MGKLTNAQREMLQLAVRSKDGNPWPLVTMRQRAGGATMRMFNSMQVLGYFDHWNRITPAGIAALTPDRPND